MAAFEPAKAKAVETVTGTTTFYAQAVDPKTGIVYVAGDDYLIHSYDMKATKKEPLAKWTKHDNYVSAMVLRRRGDDLHIVTGAYDRRLIWWDTKTGLAAKVIENAHAGWIRDAGLTPDGNRLITVGDDMFARVWEMDSGKPIMTLDGHAKLTPQEHVTALYVLAISADGKHLATGDRIGDVRVWSLDTGKEVARFAVPTVYTYDKRQRKRSLGGIRGLAFSPDGTYLAIGGMAQVDNVDGLAGKVHLEIWDWRKGQAKLVIGAENHVGMMGALTFHPTLPWLAGVGGGQDNAFVAFWKMDELAKLPPLDKKPTVPTVRHKFNGFYHRAAWSADGQSLIVSGHHLIQRWTFG